MCHVWSTRSEYIPNSLLFKAVQEPGCVNYTVWVKLYDEAPRSAPDFSLTSFHVHIVSAKNGWICAVPWKCINIFTGMCIYNGFDSWLYRIVIFVWSSLIFPISLFSSFLYRPFSMTSQPNNNMRKSGIWYHFSELCLLYIMLDSIINPVQINSS